MDAKLARSAKARAVLQTAFYSQLLAGVQGVEPRWMHLALGNGEFASFKVNDFAAYERQTRRLLAAALGGDPAAEVYPEPVEHCAICRWRELCADRRRGDDDLSLVAGMTTGQRRALKGAGISTRRGFAGLAGLPPVDRVSPDVLERAQRQARLQVASEDDGVIRYEILDPGRDGDGALVANRGLLALPEPAVGDLFFDIEGARYYSGDGERRRVVAGYNQDDCRAALALRDWLEERRIELAGRLGQELPRPVFAEKPGATEDPETARIRSALLAASPGRRLAQLRGASPRKRPRGRRGRCWPTCSTGTGARTSRPGGGTSTSAR